MVAFRCAPGRPLDRQVVTHSPLASEYRGLPFSSGSAPQLASSDAQLTDFRVAAFRLVPSRHLKPAGSDAQPTDLRVAAFRCAPGRPLDRQVVTLSPLASEYRGLPFLFDHFLG